ncbi:hypothetical protein RHSIM_Rhsim09G0114600 [Rhododendron simsii]|uniref:Uncharacterized protein n=1 Tax=Rhododendron simsii TaxID=118357 RepID=A0A834LCS0_RHOSS|nr:hypothetical protein RHSIM_Rhsim09G0114600 [Rhododendron simsii]
MASMKAEKSVGTQLFGQAKKEPAAAKDGAPKASGSSKSGSKKAAPKTSSEPKKKVIRGAGHGPVLCAWKLRGT